MDGDNCDGKDESGDEKVKVTITWSAWMTLTSFTELAIGDDGDGSDESESGDESESRDEKVKTEMKK